MKRKLVLAFRIVVLAVLYLFCFSAVFDLVIPSQQAVSDAEQAVVFQVVVAKPTDAKEREDNAPGGNGHIKLHLWLGVGLDTQTSKLA